MKKTLLLLLLPLLSYGQPCEILTPPINANKAKMLYPMVIPDSSAWVGVYFEMDYNMYLDCGSDTNVVIKRLLGYFNGIRKQFAKSGIRVYISGYKVWTTPDPYQSAMSAGQGLTMFGARHDSLNLPHDLFQCLSMHCVGCGGAGYLNTLAYQPSYRTSFWGAATGYQDNALLYPMPWNIYCPSHEIGHNLGGYHTHDNVWNGDNTMIDSCACAVNSGYCISGSKVGWGNEPLPTNGGTILSYCHALQNVGVNGNNGFGVQPSAVFMANVESASVSGVLHNPAGLPCGTTSALSAITTTTTANITWSKVGVKYKYRIRQAGQAWNAASSASVYSDAVLTGLQSNKTYFIQVKSLCNGIWSAWSMKYTFKTL